MLLYMNHTIKVGMEERELHQMASHELSDITRC
jgi:hypothetical protein